MNYYYIFEDGSIGVSSSGPTKVDLECIGDGTLQVIRTPNLFGDQFDSDGSLIPVDECRLDTDENYEDFHTL